MVVLLARTADRLFWGARYVERAEDTARVVRAYNDLVVDFPSQELLRWEPLLALHGSDLDVDIPAADPAGERTVVATLLGDRNNPASIASAVASARENLRTTREVMPREAWQAINELSQYVSATSTAAVERQLRDRFLLRVIEVSRRLDGILESTMTRSSAYHVLRLGRLIERADMTTRVLGVAAAGIIALEAAAKDELVHDEVRWMNVLRSVSALQMYQRAVRGPIEGNHVVDFLLDYGPFPRSVQGCFDELRAVVAALPHTEDANAAVDDAQAVLSSVAPQGTEGEQLDRAMDRLQIAIADLSARLHQLYVSSAL